MIVLKSPNKECFPSWSSMFNTTFWWRISVGAVEYNSVDRLHKTFTNLCSHFTLCSLFSTILYDLIYFQSRETY